jgi:hypothetical protein
MRCSGPCLGPKGRVLGNDPFTSTSFSPFFMLFFFIFYMISFNLLFIFF